MLNLQVIQTVQRGFSHMLFNAARCATIQKSVGRIACRSIEALDCYPALKHCMTGIVSLFGTVRVTEPTELSLQ